MAFCVERPCFRAQPRSEAEPNRQSAGRQRVVGDTVEARAQELCEMIATALIYAANLSRVPPDGSVRDQIRERMLERQVSLSIDGFTPIGHRR